MALRTTYANLSDGLQPFSLWDQSLADMGLLGTIPCTASGTNVITLTPNASAFAPTILTYSNYLAFSFVAVNTSTGVVTAKVGSLGTLNVYLADGVTQATTGNVLINALYTITYASNLNSNAGGFYLSNVFPGSGSVVSGGTNHFLPVFTGPTSITAAVATGTSGRVLIDQGAGLNPTFTSTPVLGASGTLGTITFGNATSGAVVVQPVTGALGSAILSLPATTDTLVCKATIDIFTNKTYDTAGTGNVFKINGTGITAVTGTGAVSLTDSPVFTTQITSPIVSGGSAAGSTLTFQTTSNGSPASDKIVFKSGSTQIGVLQSTGGGVYGLSLGTSSTTGGGIPLILFNNTGSGQFSCKYDGAGAGVLFVQASSAGPVQINQQANSSLSFFTNNGAGTQLSCFASGGVGIATNAAPADPGANAFTVVGSVKSISTSGGVGYATGSGSTVTQGTNRTTAVTINAVTGAITLISAAGSATPATFTVNNSSVAATDVIIINQKSGTDKYEIFITAVAASSFNITSFTTGGTTTEQPVFNFAIIKGVTS